MKTPRSEQETIVIYDVEVGKWHIDTTYPPHIRKYTPAMGEIEEKTQDRLAGWISDDYSGSFMTRKRKTLTDEERQRVREQLRKGQDK
ncbi:MAG: hypothetical protein LKK24_08205 [Leuconostoc mesenteroides]|jgi:hypothetical protein|uniref:hypothetical protein n=1 Tax=Leuconostoc mesenteroides TaxID=1245 RepID=UPI0023622B66|nr:hypothetical protein [Leuconostoc mesenteroides]MCH3952771.1 hypothetical protein [Leuconostoc mesenteroides]MCH3978944.1 hypothetical protein [Leuconostoc mesenteroides]MCI2089408.1 hypothetical protein [Leuconostoc mesenteroides]MCI2121048.1 hypothetical protein [Leuconostoc mesenteroides]